MGPGPVWTGGENLAPTGIRSPDRAARSHLSESSLAIFCYFMTFFNLAGEKFPGTNLDLSVFKDGLLCYLRFVWHHILKVRELNKS